jgi:hypothetical protein
MPEVMQQIWIHVQDNAVKILVGLIFVGVGWWFGRRRARYDWKRQEFFDRLNFSLNWIEEGKLIYRTLGEKRCEEVFLNVTAAEEIRTAAKLTTPTNPVLPLPKEHYWNYLNAVLNELAEQFAEGSLRREMGLPTRTIRYLICLTCECAGELRTRKIRVMVIRESTLCALPAETPVLEHARSGTRWTTLNQLAARYKSHPHEFLDVELSLPQ